MNNHERKRQEAIKQNRLAEFYQENYINPRTQKEIEFYQNEVTIRKRKIKILIKQIRELNTRLKKLEG